MKAAIRHSIVVVLVSLAKVALAQPAPAPALSQPPTLTLEDAMRRAVKSAPSIAKLQHLAGAAAELVRQARAGTLPSVAAVASATDGPTGAPAFGVTGIAGDPLKKHYGAGLNIVQTLF